MQQGLVNVAKNAEQEFLYKKLLEKEQIEKLENARKRSKSIYIRRNKHFVRKQSEFVHDLRKEQIKQL